LAVLNRTTRHKHLSNGDRLFWSVLCRWWYGWRDALVILRPETVVRWHRAAFKVFWTRRSKRRKPGRPAIAAETRKLIRTISTDNPLWGAPRLHGELKKLGIELAEATVSKYMLRTPTPPSQTWRTFLKNHAPDISAIDFFTVATARFRQLYAFIVLAHDRRRVLHINVTDSPTAAWTAQQIVEAFPWSTALRYLLRDRDGVFGDELCRRVKALDIEEVVTAARSPWQNPFVERIIGSIRRECLDHIIVFSEAHLRRILAEYFDYYHRSRTHLSLAAGWSPPPPLHPQGSLTTEDMLACAVGPHSGFRNLRASHLFCGGALHQHHRTAELDLSTAYTTVWVADEFSEWTITSLWHVLDEATRRLMAEFYRRMWAQKKPKAQAMWEAKMVLRNEKNPDGTHRYPMSAWAGWVLSGSGE
jgi:transposase InsO family protein